MLRGLPYRVVQDHHAIQQSGQGIKNTSIQTYRGREKHSIRVSLLLGPLLTAPPRSGILIPVATVSGVLGEEIPRECEATLQFFSMEYSKQPKVYIPTYF